MNAVNTSIYSTLATGASLTNLLPGTSSIYHMQAPDAATYPYVVFSKVSGGPLNINPRDLRDEIYFIRAYSTTSALVAGSIDVQISALIQGKTLTVTGYGNYYTVREGEFELVETLPNGKQCWMAGANYRIRLSA